MKYPHSAPEDLFVHACTDPEYREAEESFACWIINDDMASTETAIVSLPPAAAARGAAAIHAVLAADLWPRRRAFLQTLERLLIEASCGEFVPRGWAFDSVRMEQRIYEQVRLRRRAESRDEDHDSPRGW